MKIFLRMKIFRFPAMRKERWTEMWTLHLTTEAAWPDGCQQQFTHPQQSSSIFSQVLRQYYHVPMKVAHVTLHWRRVHNEHSWLLTPDSNEQLRLEQLKPQSRRKLHLLLNTGTIKSWKYSSQHILWQRKTSGMYVLRSSMWWFINSFSK